MSNFSKQEPPFFRMDDRNPAGTQVDSLNENYEESAESHRSRTPPPEFQSRLPEDRNAILAALKPPLYGQQTEKGQNVQSLPSLIEDWTPDHVKHWLVVKVRLSEQIAQNLYEQGLSGACLVSFKKQDFLDLGVPAAPAILIIKQVEKMKMLSVTSEYVPTSPSELKQGGLCRAAECSGNLDESHETLTVSSDSGIESTNSTVQMLQEARQRIRSVIDKNTDVQPCQLSQDNTATAQLKKPICQIRPFDKSQCAWLFYTENDLFPPMAGPSNLLNPVHEYHLLPNTDEVSEKEIIYEFTREVFCFAGSCMNSRTNGTIHFGVISQPGSQHGLVVGHKISSFSVYEQAFESSLSAFFDEQHVNVARMCIRPPNFTQIHHQDGTTSDRWVIEVDVVPEYLHTQDHLFYTHLCPPSTEEKQQSEIECLFIREGPQSVNILADPNARLVQKELKSLTDKVKNWASARKSAEKKNEHNLSESHQGQRLKQLISRGRDAYQTSLQVILVTDKCHHNQLEHMDFLKEIKLFAVLEFDPESDINGTCHFFRKDRVANLHYPRMYTSQDSLTTVAGRLNLFKQTSWIFCNGQKNEDSDADKPLTPSEWLKKRSGDISNMVTLLCNPDLIGKDRLLVMFVLHSAVADISSPILETFCAIYRTLEGADNILCICKDPCVFTRWKQLIEVRCKEDISSKCIYELSLNEISSTVKKLKQPQTQSSLKFLPSTGLSSVLLTKKDEELFTVLDILTENECENTEIERNDAFNEFKKKTEEDFYKGGQVTWWNFYLSEKPGSLPFIKRDKFNELHDLLTPVEGYTSPCVMINLFHHPGCGGTTLAMHVLWNLRRKFRCAVVKNNRATNNEISAQVVKLLTYGKQEQSGNTPVLLLVDNRDDIEDLKQDIIASDRKCHNGLMVIILNCERTPFPEESSRNSRLSNVFITNKLSSTEQSLFSEKLQQLKDDHEKPETFYAFMIMTKNFSEAYITNLVSNIIRNLDISTNQGRLFSFLALLNSYVNGSYMSLSLCEELVGIKNALWRQETLDDKMNPYSTLLLTFTVEEHGTYQAVRFLHQMIASKSVQILNQEHKLSLSETTINMIHCDRIYKSSMGKDFLVQNIQSMLITRHRKEQGDEKDTLFSPLIEQIHEDEGPKKIKEVLEKATVRFERSATIPQALARHFYLKEEDFQSALHWALDAQSKKSNSYIADTVGQVYKTQLKRKMKDIKDSMVLTPEALDEYLVLGSKAMKAFKKSQEQAKTDEQVDPFDPQTRKKSYNISGYVGETEVIITLLEYIKDLPLSAAPDRLERDKMLQFLKGHHSLNSLQYNHSNATIVQLVAVLERHERFLTSLKPRLREMFEFFDNYFTYLRPRSQERETADVKHKRRLSEYFKKYMQIFELSEGEKASEKASHPNLSLHQQLQEKRNYLEAKRADSFAGLLQCLTDKNGPEMEHILKRWKFIFDNTPSRSVSDTVNFILANIVMHSIKPSSQVTRKYEELVELLNKELQKEGTHSSLTEMYYLSMLLMWPVRDTKLDKFPTYRNISTYTTSIKKSFHRRFSHMFPARSAISHFFLGKSSGLKRIVSKVKLDQILINISRQDSISAQSGQQRKLHNLWQSGAAWNEPKVQNELLRIKGKSENGEIYVNYGSNLRMSVRPVYLGDIRSGYSQEEVSFYLGFTMEGPVAYNIKY